MRKDRNRFNDLKISAAGQEQPTIHQEAKRTSSSQSNVIVPTNNKFSKQPKISDGSSNEKQHENIIYLVKTESIAVDVDCDSKVLTPGQQNMEQDSYQE